MKLTYDPRYNIAYLAFRDKAEEVETVQVSDYINVDLASDGTVYGIELLNVNEQLHVGPDATLLVVNEERGTSSGIKLPA